MPLHFELWDVFTDKALAGNQLAVISDATGLSTAQMQAIAREFNLSETSFILPSDKADVRARFFTPARELPMAGHPSIGTLYALQAAGKIQAENASLELGIGVVPMRLEYAEGQLQRVWMDQGVPKLLAEVHDRQAVARALGIAIDDLIDTLPIQVVSAGNPFMLVAVDSLEVLTRVSLDLASLPAELMAEHRAVLVFTLDAPESDVRVRMFGEAMGVREDPATGSAHGPLGWYLVTHGLFEFDHDSLELISHQGVEMGRSSILHLRVSKTEQGLSISVGGSAVKVAEGQLLL
jgi:trans-2,3-dihydro-3-hydroxyanthranilate isomerase